MKPLTLLQRFSPHLWPVAVLVIGVGLSFLLGNELQQRAVETWQKRADQDAARQSMILLSWIEESYGMLSGIVALVENSSKVDADEFLNAVDGLETRAKVNFIPVKAMMERGRKGWATKYSTAAATADPAFPKPATAPAALLLETLAHAQDTPNEWLMSIPFADANGSRHIYVVLVPASKNEFALVGVLGVQRMLDSLLGENSRAGMFLELKLKAEGSEKEAVMAVTPSGSPVIHRSTTLTQTAHTNLELIWQFTDQFDGGIDRRLSRGVAGGGTLLTVLLAVFVASTHRQNQRIQQRVEEATRELAIALEEAEAATKEKSSTLADLEKTASELTVALDKAKVAALEKAGALDELAQTTQRLALENEERLKSDKRTRLILNSVGEGIFGVDAEERGTFFNDTAARLLGYSADEMTGREIHDLIHHSREDRTPLAPEDRPMHGACSTGKSCKVSGEVLWRKDGSWFFSEYSVTPIAEEKGGAAGAVVVFRDITEQRRNQEELQLRMNELERFNRLVMGREERMIQLKREINTLLEAHGAKKKYKDMDAESSISHDPEIADIEPC